MCIRDRLNTILQIRCGMLTGNFSNLKQNQTLHLRTKPKCNMPLFRPTRKTFIEVKMPLCSGLFDLISDS